MMGRVAAERSDLAVATSDNPRTENPESILDDVEAGMGAIPHRREVDRRRDRVLLGVHILGELAAELIHLGQMAVSLGKPIDWFIHATFNVPTFSEAYKYAAYDGLQRLAGRGPGKPGA